MTIRFLHSADWQLGMTRHFLNGEAQARYTADRLEAVREIGRIAKAERCEFVVVCGDVFETNQVDRKTVARACEALASFEVPVFLLPGNHDPIDAGSVFRMPTFLAKKPPHVIVLDDKSPREVRPGVEVVGAPWTSKRPLTDLVADAAASLEPTTGVIRVMVGHGAVDSFSSEPNPALVSLVAAQASIGQGHFHYLALGDHHSLRQVDGAGRVWYSGTPLVTDFNEARPGEALVVELSATTVTATPHPVSSWRFLDETRDVMNHADLDALEQRLNEIERKDRVVLRLSLRGSLTLQQRARLDALIDQQRDLFGSLHLWQRHSDLVVVPEDADFADLQLSGFAQAAVAKLREMATGANDQANTARDALALLVRLAGRRA